MARLTIGMACYDDYNGVYFSVQSLQMHHSEVMDQSEIIVVDNNPNSPDGIAVKEFMNWVKNGRYIPFSNTTGTAMPRNTIFEEADGQYVLCMDSHVLIDNGAVKKLIDFYDDDLDNGNLLQGPMLYDNLIDYASHMDPVWRSEMYGVWGTDVRANSPDNTPFEIKMHGLGLFSCRKSEWLGFNKDFRGFGGEEGYIHEKYRMANKKTLCLPFLRWLHRFGRPRGVDYPLTIEDKLRNYLIGAKELGQDIKPIIEHFEPLIPVENVMRLLKQFGVMEKI